MEHNVTGIPSDVLFLFIGALLAIIYGDLRHQLKSLRRSSHWRDEQIRHLSSYMRLVCHKLNIRYRDENDETGQPRRRRDDPP